MFTKKPQDIKKSTQKIQDIKKDSATRLKHLKAILDNVDIEEAKSIFETNYSHVYYILYDTFVQAESNLKQRELTFHLVHKAHREELDGSLWLLEKILCLLPELLSRRWQVHSLSRVLAKLIHHGNGTKLRRDGVRFFLMWYQALGENAPQIVHSMFNELVPGLSIPHKNYVGPSEMEFNSQDILSHPNMRGELGTSVFHDTSSSHPVMSADIGPLLPPTSGDKTSAAPNPRDGLEILLECITQSSGSLRWRENCQLKHIRGFNFLLQRFREVYLPVLCPNFDHSFSVYEPRLDLPVMRTISKKEEVMSSCVVVLVTWVAKHTHEKPRNKERDRAIEYDFLNSSSFTQSDLVRTVFYSTRENVNFIHEVYRQALLLNYTTIHQIEAMRIAITIYNEWLNSPSKPPFLVEPDEPEPRSQKFRADSYVDAIGNLSVKTGAQNILQVFMTNTVNVFMVQTAHLDIRFSSRLKEGISTPLDKQNAVCRLVLNTYRSMVMRMPMDQKTYEQLLLVLLQITSITLTQATPNSKENLGGRLAQQIFQTLIVTWVRAHTMVTVNPVMWDKFVKVLSSLTHREELINQWKKIMQTLTRVMVRQVYNLFLNELPLDRLSTQKRKRRRIGGTSSDGGNLDAPIHCATPKPEPTRTIPGTPCLNRSYSEGSLMSFRKSTRMRRRQQRRRQELTLPADVETSLSRILSNISDNHLSISSETLNSSNWNNQGVRRAISLNSVRIDDNYRSSRSPSPTSLGIEGESVKALQLDGFGGDSSSIEDDHFGSDKKSIMSGGTMKGWTADVAAVMWKRMIGSLGDVNKILNPKLHAEVFEELVTITESLLKVRLNQGISIDNQSTPPQPVLVPPIALITPWCYGALALDPIYQSGKLYAMQILCMIVRQGISLGQDQLPLFYAALHQALTGEDRAMVFTVLRCLGGGRFLSLLLPGHSLLLLDFVHASTVVLNSKDLDYAVPRAEVANLLGSLLCYPRTSLPGPVLQPSEPHIELMECPDLQEHILNIVLRCARREQSARARCVALSSLGHWILQNCQQNFNNPRVELNSRIPEAMRTILQALQHRHSTIARSAIEALRLVSEKGKVLAKSEALIPTIINAICASLNVQNKRNPSDSDKIVLTSLLLCLGEFCMSIPTKLMLLPRAPDTPEPLILAVLRICHNISQGQYSNQNQLFTADDDFDHTIEVDDLQEPLPNDSTTKQNVEKCQATIRLCAKTVTTHLVTNLAHFPIGIGATRLSSLVDEQDDLSFAVSNRDSIDMAACVVTAQNIQLFMLNPELMISLIELPTLKLPGGGITAGIVTANRQVRLLLRDLNGKSCWDASILYCEPKVQGENSDSTYHTPLSGFEKSPFFNERPNAIFGKGRNFQSADPMMSTLGFPINPIRHTLRHRPPGQLPVASEVAPDLDQLDDLLQYIGHTSSECLVAGASLNTSAASPLSPNQEAQTITTLLNQRSIEGEFLTRQSMHSSNYFVACSNYNSLNYSAGAKSLTDTETVEIDQCSGSYYSDREDLLSFHYCRLLFSQLGLAGWERRRKTYMLKRTDKLMRELRNLDSQRCRETHKVAVIYVANGQEDKNSILSNDCGSSAYEMFVSAMGWEVELESHNGFLGGLPRQGCGSTAAYYATPFLEIIYHVATRMPCNTSEALLNKTRHLGNDEVHIVWSEHYRDYRRDILPTEFCDVLIIIYPLKSGLFRITVNRKQDVPWFGPLSNECVVGGACLASLVRATAINASRAKRMSLNHYQQFYEERYRSLDVVSSRHKEPTTYEEFAARIYTPIPQHGSSTTTSVSTSAAALLDSQRSKRSSSYFTHPEVTVSAREITQHTIASVSLDHASPRPLRKIHHPFQTAKKKSHSTASSTSSQHHQSSSNSPPDSPTLGTNNNNNNRRFR